MKILFHSLKGRQGKTTHAISYAKYKNYKLYTNDIDNCTPEIFKGILEKNKMITLKTGDLNKNFLLGENWVFDCGGFVENRIYQFAKLADICVIPICYQSLADLAPAITNILKLQKICNNIAILINNTEKYYISQLEEILKQKFPQHPIFVINRSKFFARLADEKKTIFDLYNQGNLYKHSLRNLVPQIKKFYHYLDTKKYE